MKEIKEVVALLTNDHGDKYPSIPIHKRRLPSSSCLNDIIDCIRATLFPGYYGTPMISDDSLSYHTGVNVEKISNLLTQQVFDSLLFQSAELDPGDAKQKAHELVAAFLNQLPHIKYLLSTDISAIFDSDPAAKSYGEIIFCYPAVKAISNYRIAHELYKLNIPIIPRIITEMAHAETGIEIHPGAEIGEYFSIDHGTGIVIGATSIIGKHVMLYQGVTLGAKSFTLDEDGHPMDVPRHPILEDNVTIYSNSSILGRITIGKGTIVGGNIWLTHSVPPFSKITQTRAIKDKE
jgi:Serine acetyltransferase